MRKLGTNCVLCSFCVNIKGNPPQILESHGLPFTYATSETCLQKFIASFPFRFFSLSSRCTQSCGSGKNYPLPHIFFHISYGQPNQKQFILNLYQIESCICYSEMICLKRRHFIVVQTYMLDVHTKKMSHKYCQNVNLA